MTISKEAEAADILCAMHSVIIDLLRLLVREHEQFRSTTRDDRPDQCNTAHNDRYIE